MGFSKYQFLDSISPPLTPFSLSYMYMANKMWYGK